jgi:DNA-binding transcriptional LysR family regulator
MENGSAPQIQIHQFQYFLAVAQEHNFTRAAAKVGVAQPSISEQIRKLETDLGVKLFHRTRGGVALTPAGEIFLPWARQVLADVDEAVGQIKDLDGLLRGELAIGATPSICRRLLPVMLGRLHKLHPAVTIRVRESGSQELIDQLGRGELDVALVVTPTKQEGFASVALAEEKLVLVVPNTHPLASRSSIGVKDLRDLPLVSPRNGYDIRAVTVAACRRACFEPWFTSEGGEIDVVLALVHQGLGASVVPSIVAADGLTRVAISRPALRRTIRLVFRSERVLPRTAQVAVDQINYLFSDEGWPYAEKSQIRFLTSRTAA